MIIFTLWTILPFCPTFTYLTIFQIFKCLDLTIYYISCANDMLVIYKKLIGSFRTHFIFMLFDHFSHLGIILCSNRYFQVLTYHIIKVLILICLYINITIYMSKHIITAKITNNSYHWQFCHNKFWSTSTLYTCCI